MKIYFLRKTLTAYLVLAVSFLYAQQSERNGDPISKRLLFNDIGGISVRFDFPEHTTSEIKVNGDIYHFIHIPGTGKMQEPGLPALPAISELIAVPFDAVAALSEKSERYTDHTGYNIHPALQPATDTYGDPEPEFEIDNVQYATDAFFPENIIEVVDTFIVRGMQVAVVQIRPVQFNPVKGVIRVHDGITLEMLFSGANRTFEPFAQNNSLRYTEKISGLFLNGNILPSGTETIHSTPYADYIILTIDPYKSAADSIAKWRRQMGFHTEVISRPSWSTQQVKNDVHSRFHQYLPHPDYLLIVGDHDHVPAEMITQGTATFPSDLYYVCMFGSRDHFPDMAKGRISVSSPSEAMMVALRIIDYERDPINDSAFYYNGLHCAQFQDDDTNGYATRRFTHTSEEVRDYMMGFGYDVERVYHTYSYVNPTNYNDGRFSNGEPVPADLLRANGFQWNGNQNMVANAINNGKFYVLHRDHGYVGGSGWAHPYFTNSSMHLLSNGDKRPVVFSLNCHTGDFSRPSCFAESLLRLPAGGAIGVVGASGTSYSGYNDAIAAGLFDAIWNNPGLLPVFGTGGVSNPNVLAHPPILALGDVLHHAMIRMVQTWNGTTNANRRQYRMYHYLGDPAMKIFTQYPSQIIAQIPDTLIVGSTNLDVAACNVPDAKVTILWQDELIAKGMLNNGNGMLNFQPVNDTSYSMLVTVSKHNYRPLIKKVVVASQGTVNNNNPCDAIHLTVKKYCDPLYSGFAGADASSVPYPLCANYQGSDVWFSFVAPSSGNAEVEVAGTNNPVGVAAYSANCLNPLFFDCDTNKNSSGIVLLQLTSLIPGDTMLVRVWENAQNTAENFTVCVREPDTFPVAQLPYYTGFENGIDQYWELVSSDPAGRIRIDSVCDARYGNNSLLMDVSVNGVYAQNEARLRVDLRGKESVKLKFWWREYGDETDEEDGVFLSDDGGDNYVKIIELQGAFEGWTQYVVDIDQMAARYGLKLTESFVIKFQQYDNWQMICSNPTGGDGFAFDDIYVYVDTTMNSVASVPYFTGFEDGFDQFWSLNSTHPLGRIVVTGAYPPIYAGDYFLMMDVSSSNNYNLNSCDLKIDLTGYNDLMLTFFWKSFRNEPHPENGIYFSDDNGATFTQVKQLLDTNQYWSEKNLNIGVLCQAYNLTPNADFIIRLVQYDNWPVRNDGFGFDNLHVYQTTEPVIDMHPIGIYCEVDTGQVETKQFNIINQGTLPLTIDSIHIPVPFQTTFSAPAVIQPGDTNVVSLSFHPTTVMTYEGQIKVFHNASRGLDTIMLEGLGMHRELEPSITALLFDTLEVNTRDTIEFELTNIGNGAVRTSSMFVPNGFEILTSDSQSFNPSQSRPVRVKFEPHLKGIYGGFLIITSDANNLDIPISGFAYDPLSVEDLEQNDQFTVFPNPCNDYIRIETDIDDQYYIILNDMAGRTLVHKKALRTKDVDMRLLAAGIYLLELRSKDNTPIFRTKIIKE